MRRDVERLGAQHPTDEQGPETIVSNAQKPSRMKREKYGTHQHKEYDPWRKDERGEERRDRARGEFWIRAEGMHDLGTRMV